MIGTYTSSELSQHYGETGEWTGQLIDDFVHEAAFKYPDKSVFIDPRHTITFAEFNDSVNRLAQGMMDRGVRKGDVVSWQLPNWIEAAVIHIATVRIGAVSNPIIPIYRDREVSFILEQSKSRLVFIPSVHRGHDYREMYQRISGDIPSVETVVVVDEDNGEFDAFHDLFAAPGVIPPAVERTPNDVVLLLYTSGTVAEPKGVLHSHNTLTYENHSMISLLEFTKHDRIFMPSPVSHITGLLYGIQLPFMLGTTCVFQDQWNAQEAVALIDEHQLTFATGATPFLHGIIAELKGRDPEEFSLKTYACGGADVPPSLISDAVKALGAFVTRVYGSSELPTVTASGPEDPKEKWSRTDGRRIGNVEMRLRRTDQTVAQPGEEGELEVRGAELFLGYLNPSLNDAAFTSDGWFRTGDLGVEDEDGYISITGRTKDIIVRGGENISAKEIEDILFTDPRISDVAVVGQPDPVLVERIRVYVISAPGETVTLDDITEILKRHRLATQKRPERLVIVDEFPRTASGKVQKRELREMARRDV